MSVAEAKLRQALDVVAIRSEFPVLDREAHPGVPLIYLDSAATSQKPRPVIEAMSRFYEQTNANIHRGVHRLAEEATAAFEDARAEVARFIGAPSSRTIVFTRNTTEAINLVARSWGGANLKQGDVVVLTEMEHHSNLVPWQMLAAERGLRLEFIPVTPEGRLDLAGLPQLLGLRPRLVALAHMSNMLGTINPVAEIAEQAHQAGALVLIDAAQSVPHMAVDVGRLEADFLAFSAHKMCGPTGIGVLYAREDLLEAMPPFLGGGDMIKRVELRSFVANEIPYKFEAGTPAIAEAIGLREAIRFLDRVGLDSVHTHEQHLATHAIDRLEEVPGVKVYGPPAEERGGVVAFTLEGIHPHDIAQLLDSEGVAVRAGHHCAMPVHQKFGIPASTRASFYLYNTLGEVDRLVEGLYRVKSRFA
ncbi:MAG: cysteine desulfurase [Gammaproteobacteria bacterium RBG_16_66_13]|nr:MAG: cysteine desulfurase [Gammaproteobacteria bacterium RBG_16_66_13]